MKLLTKDTDYAVRALLVLAQNKKSFISIKDISLKEQIPYHFLRRVVQKLIKNKIVESKEGALGGVKLVKDPLKIKIVDIIKIFQGSIELSQCMFRKKICPNRNGCVLRKEIKRVEKIVTEEFDGISIAKLLKNMKSRR